jgi:hypothetical protein
VLGESWNKGWRASCDGRSLGEPRVIDGFANGWGLPSSCRDASITFAPQAGVLGSYIVGGLAVLALLAIALAGWLRARRDRPPAAALEPLPGEDSPSRVAPLVAIAIGVAAALVLGFVFALRAGIMLGPALALILWRGVPVRTLILAAGALLALVVPAIYALFTPEDRGGYNTEYAKDLLGAHWVTLAAVVLLGLALVRMVSTARARGAGGARSRA